MNEKDTESTTLVVAWDTGKNTHARQVKASTSVLEHLREEAAQVDNLIREGEGKAYDPDDEQGESDYLTLTRADLLDPNLERELSKGPSLPSISAEELRRRSLRGYGLVTGNDPEQRRLYIKKRSPVQLLSKSLVTHFNGALSKIEDPVLAFGSLFDVVVDGENIWALHQTNFEGLFKESAAVLAMTEEWVDDFANAVPMSEEACKELAVMVRRNGVLRRKLQSVLRKPHIASMTPDLLQKAIEDHGLETEKIMPDGELIVNQVNAKQVLNMLNEDLWEGYFSANKWASNRKSQR